MIFYTAQITIKAVKQYFGNRIIFKDGGIHRPPRSPDWTAYDFAQKPQDVKKLKN